jgi:hypothetical protein
MNIIRDLINEVLILFRMKLLNNFNYNPLIFLGGVWGFWPRKGLSKYLQKRKLRAFLFDYHRKSKDFDECVEKLNLFIEKRNLNHITFIGHSMGGLTAVYYCNKYGWNNIDKVICVCTPFKGLRNFGLFNIFIPKDLKHDSKFLKRLKAKKVKADKITCIYSKWDEFMKKDSCVLANSKNVELPVYGHNVALEMKKLQIYYDKYLN